MVETTLDRSPTSRRKFRFPLTLLASAAMISVGLAFAQPDAKPHRTSLGARTGLDSEERESIRLFQTAAPSVVYITTKELVLRGGGVRLDIGEIPQGAGSGFVWDKQGHIVTNFHVIKDADRALVTLAEKAGLLPTRFNPGGELVLGDMIVDIEGITIESADELIAQLRKRDVGDVVRLSIDRTGEQVSLDVQLEEI